MKEKVYIETTIISYLTARPSRDIVIAAHQQVTIDWWENELSKFSSFISPIVIEEASRGDKNAAKLRLQIIEKIPILEINDDILGLAELYFKRIPIPDKAKADALHLAVATYHGMNYLISWNFAHILNGRVRELIQEINLTQGIITPIICTPEELIEV